MPDQESILEQLDMGVPQATTWGYGLPALEVDVEKYRAYVRNLDLTEDQEGQLIQALWGMMMAFVDLGFGIHPAQRAVETRRWDENCGDNCDALSEESSASVVGMLKCLIEKADDLTERFEMVAAPKGA